MRREKEAYICSNMNAKRMHTIRTYDYYASVAYRLNNADTKNNINDSLATSIQLHDGSC